MIRSLARFGCVVGMIVVAGATVGCSTNKTTGRSQFAMLSPDEERAIGISEGPKLTAEFGGESPNPQLRAYITEVGMKLKDQTEEDGPQRVWVFTLLNSDVINAFALPGERVFMSQGLADQMTNEAQLAGVLGHEIGHVMARHTSERMGQAAGANILAGAASVIAGATIKDPTLAGAVPQIVGAGGQVVTLKFSRDQESEADSLGMRYMTKAFYNPRGQLEVMEILKREAGEGAGLEMLATHPLPQTRIERVQKELQTKYAFTQSGPDAAKYQFFPERFRQRYLDVRAAEKKAAPAPATPAAPNKSTKPAQKSKTGALPVDGKGRTRNLAFVYEDPTTWCSICRWNAEQGIVEDAH